MDSCRKHVENMCFSSVSNKNCSCSCCKELLCMYNQSVSSSSWFMNFVVYWLHNFKLSSSKGNGGEWHSVQCSCMKYEILDQWKVGTWNLDQFLAREDGPHLSLSVNKYSSSTLLQHFLNLILLHVFLLHFCSMCLFCCSNISKLRCDLTIQVSAQQLKKFVNSFCVQTVTDCQLH